MRVYEKFELMQEQALVPVWCANHFGIDPLSFDSYRFWQRVDGRSIWITPVSFTLPNGVDLASVGMLVMRKPPPTGKPTSVFLQRFAKDATRNCYVLSEDQALAFLKREPMPITPIDDGRGYAVVRTMDRVIGCGRIRGRQLYSEIPKHWLAEL